MIRLIFIFAFSFLVFSCKNEKKKSTVSSTETSIEEITTRYVDDNTLISKELPEIAIAVDTTFSFVGWFDFEIIANSDEYSSALRGKPVAAGERWVFAAADENKSINKLFIVQFEGFLPENDLIYNYNFNNAELIGENKYRHNTWFYDSKKLAAENPKNEGAKTRRFLENNGFQLEDHYMMSRYVGLASEDRKNEIIIFYLEMLKKTTGYTLDEYENTISPEQAKSIRTAFVKRSEESFEVIKG